MPLAIAVAFQVVRIAAARLGMNSVTFGPRRIRRAGGAGVPHAPLPQRPDAIVVTLAVGRMLEFATDLAFAGET